MTTIGDPSSEAINGNGAPDPETPVKTPDLSIRTPERSPPTDPSYFPNVPSAIVTAEHEAGSAEIEKTLNINHLAFKRDPPVARGPYFSTQVE